MKNFLLFLLVLGIGTSTFAQERYLDTIFNEVEITKDIVYGNNITVLPAMMEMDPELEELKFDFFEPKEDSLELRPLVLLCHTGNFLPHPLNESVNGSKDDDYATIEMARRLAKMGYVAANMDYRLGWNPLADSQDEKIGRASCREGVEGVTE